MVTGKSAPHDAVGMKRARVLQGRHVLAMFLGAFGLVMGVNAVFITYALTSWSGLSVEQPYDRGIRYNQVLRVDQAERALGWSVQGSYDGQRIVTRLTDRSGAPVDGATVTARLERPTNEGTDQECILTPVGNGLYEGDATVPLAGQWDLLVVATRGADHLHWRSRVIVPQGGETP